MNLYYNRQGEPISHEEWGRDFRDMSKRRIDLVEYSDGDFVSTVFLGLNHNYGEGLPLIFESMSFELGEWNEQDRYTTEAEAVEGHKAMVKRVEERRGKRTGFERKIQLD